MFVASTMFPESMKSDQQQTEETVAAAVHRLKGSKLPVSICFCLFCCQENVNIKLNIQIVGETAIKCAFTNKNHCYQVNQTVNKSVNWKVISVVSFDVFVKARKLL